MNTALLAAAIISACLFVMAFKASRSSLHPEERYMLRIEAILFAGLSVICFISYYLAHLLDSV